MTPRVAERGGSARREAQNKRCFRNTRGDSLKPPFPSSFDSLRPKQSFVSYSVHSKSNLRANMAPLTNHFADATTVAVGAVLHRSIAELSRRDLSVNSTQKVTLGIIAVYVVVIALLWNIPYVRWSLWPFKVRISSRTGLHNVLMLFSDASHCFPRVWTCYHGMLYRWTR